MKKQNHKNNEPKKISLREGIALRASKNRTEFMEFLKGYNIIGLAVGVVIGNSVKDLVTSIANDLVMPIIGIITPTGSYKDISIYVHGAQVKVGSFIGSLLDFVIIALVIYVVVKKIFRIEVNK